MVVYVRHFENFTFVKLVDRIESIFFCILQFFLLLSVVTEPITVDPDDIIEAIIGIEKNLNQIAFGFNSSSNFIIRTLQSSEDEIYIREFTFIFGNKATIFEIVNVFEFKETFSSFFSFMSRMICLRIFPNIWIIL